MGKSLQIKSLRALLLFFVIGLAALASSGARAATLYGGDYARVGVPDLEQAVTFFRDVLDCRLIGANSTAEAGARRPSTTRLLSCDAGSIVELFDNRGMSPPPAPGKSGPTLQFVSNDVLHASEWLQHEGVSVSGSPHRLTSGPLAGRMVLDFTAPWGMPLQLLGRDAHTPADGTLATADARFGGY